MPRNNTPPRLARFLISRLGKYQKDFAILGDMEELYEQLEREQGWVRTYIWYWVQAVFVTIKYLVFTSKRGTDMFRNYLKIALRNVIKQKGYSFINISGLTFGVTCCLLILLYVNDELSYDKHHQDVDRIFRIAGTRVYPESTNYYAVSPTPMAAVLEQDFPEVEEITRIWQWSRGFSKMPVNYQEKSFNEGRFFFADSSIFHILNIPFIEGDPNSALAGTHKLVVTQETAQRYFGDEGALGKTIMVNDTSAYTVTGVVDGDKYRSHFNFDFLASMVSVPQVSQNPFWLNYYVYTYVKLAEGVDPGDFQDKFEIMGRKYIGPQLEQYLNSTFDQFRSSGNEYGQFLQPITDIHLNSHYRLEMEINGNGTIVYSLALIAGFILFIACINFMNLVTARSAGRAKEIGVRKVLGSLRKQLVHQFISESILISLVAFLGAIFAVQFLIPGFNQLTNKELVFNVFGNWYVIPSILVFAVIVGLVAGSYPALYLSSFKPLTVLRGKLSSGTRNSMLRNTLVIVQFSISTVLVIGTFTVTEQIEYMLTKDLGFDKEHVIILEGASNLNTNYDPFVAELRTDPNIVNVAGSNTLPGRKNTDAILTPVGEDTEGIQFAVYFADHNFLDALGIDLLQGRYFSEEIRSDSVAVVINDAAVKQFGWDDPLDKVLIGAGGGTNLPLKIIGVIDNVNFETLHTTVRPMYIGLNSGNYNVLSVKFRSTNVEETLAFIQDSWSKFAPGAPFNYSFFDQEYEALYRSEELTGKIFSIFATIAILISVLGLFGLSAFISQQKTKEIGVRKVLGATIESILLLVSKDFVKLVSISFLIAAPLAYWSMTFWLENFAYRVPASPLLYLSVGMLTLFVALVTISFQAIKASFINPINALKDE